METKVVSDQTKNLPDQLAGLSMPSFEDFFQLSTEKFERPPLDEVADIQDLSQPSTKKISSSLQQKRSRTGLDRIRRFPTGSISASTGGLESHYLFDDPVKVRSAYQKIDKSKTITGGYSERRQASSGADEAYQDSYYPKTKLSGFLNEVSRHPLDDYLQDQYLSLFLQALIDKLASPRLRGFALAPQGDVWSNSLVVNFLKQSERSLLKIQAIFNGAKRGAIATKAWKRRLKDVMCKVERMLDNISVLRSTQLNPFSRSYMAHIGMGMMQFLTDELYFLAIQTKGTESLSSKDTGGKGIPTPNDDSEEPSTCVTMSDACRSIDSLPEHLKRCLLYTSLFPRNHEFDKDTLVHLWMAIGFIPDGGRRMEDIGGDYFEALLSRSFFQESSLDHSKCKSTYKLPDDVYDLIQERVSDEYARVEDGKSNHISESTLHSSLIYKNIDPMIFEAFHKSKTLLSLLLLHEHRESIKQIPYDLFLNLSFLRVLDLSRTQITELPSSIENLENLRYLDLSKTSIRRLPESVSTLSDLQILKLRDCLDLVELPEDINNLFNLRHLDLDIVRQLTFMPPRMGTLTNLQTLSAFIVGRKSGFQIEELKYMTNLRGSLCIVKLDNVLNVMEAEEATLHDKEYLQKLELQWSVSQSAAEEILEGLRPHTNLTELEIVCYGGRQFPSWVGDSSFSKIVTLNLYNCQNCILLPPLGQLPLLKSLHIREMHAVVQIDHQFCGDGMVKGFPKLETLDFDGMPCLEKWTGVEVGDMPCLQKLTIVDCPKLVILPILSRLASLQHLEIILCHELPSFPDDGLPTSLQSLVITDCPILEELCLTEEGEERNKIASIPNIWIDYQQISKS